jgi:DNA-binding transcriptional LysR family regulator
VGGRLFQRSTRAVRLTPDGEQFLGSARALVSDADEWAAMFKAPSTLRGRGRVRVRPDLPQGIALAANRQVLRREPMPVATRIGYTPLNGKPVFRATRGRRMKQTRLTRA